MKDKEQGRYCLITKNKEDIITKDELESSKEAERNKFSCNIVAKGALINALS